MSLNTIFKVTWQKPMYSVMFTITSLFSGPLVRSGPLQRGSTVRSWITIFKSWKKKLVYILQYMIIKCMHMVVVMKIQIDIFQETYIWVPSLVHFVLLCWGKTLISLMQCNKQTFYNSLTIRMYKHGDSNLV